MPTIALRGNDLDWRLVQDVMTFPHRGDLRDRAGMLDLLKREFIDTPDRQNVQITAEVLHSLIAGPGQRELLRLGKEEAPKGYCAGIILGALYLMHAHKDAHPEFEEPSLNKAEWYASQFVERVSFGVDEDGNPNTLHHSKKKVVEYRKTFMPVAHLWAAHVLYQAQSLSGPVKFPRSKEETIMFLGMARHLYEFGVSTYPVRQKDPEPYLDAETSWRVPDHIEAVPVPVDVPLDALLEAIRKF